MEHNRPLLKGIFHLFATISYIMVLPSLIAKIPPGKEIPIGLYLLSVILNFGSSALLHLFSWPDKLMIYPQKLDHVMIFVKIACTYYAAIATVIHDINPLVIYVIIAGIVSGILLRVFYTQAPNPVIAIPYIIMGWSILLDPYIISAIYERIPDAFVIALFGGLSYTIGGIIYIMKYPNPHEKYLGYHELFHIFTIVGAISFTICIFDHAIPYHVTQS